jgi:hypothetical protein
VKSIISGHGSGKGLQDKDMIDFSFVAPFLSSFLLALKERTKRSWDEIISHVQNPLS